MKKIKQSGIYKIINNINDKFYIGSSIDLDKRRRDHFNMKNKSGCTLIRAAMKKHGSENFKFIVMEQINAGKDIKDRLLRREQYFLNKLLRAHFYILNGDKYFLQHGYNLNPTSSSRLGSKLLTANKQIKPVGEYNELGELVAVWKSAKEAAEHHNITHGNVTRKCRSNKKHKCGIVFKYVNEHPVKNIPIEKYIRNIKITEAWKKNISLGSRRRHKLGAASNSAKKYLLITDGGSQLFDSQKSVKQYLRISNVTVLKMIRGGHIKRKPSLNKYKIREVAVN